MLKEQFERNYGKIINIIGCVIFLTIAFRLFCNVTYLFRNPGFDSISHIAGLKNEDDIDMVYFGGSAAFVYWEPLKAWNDCGFTSYNYATNTVQAESIKAYIKEARSVQNLDLCVVDARAFEYYSDDEAEAGLRRSTDCMDVTSPRRYELLREYFSNRNVAEDTDELSYYLDIAKYHTNTENLASSVAWKYINNNAVSRNKGWEWMNKYGYLEEPENFITDERAELAGRGMSILEDLLSYCQKEDLKVLFVVCPFYITKEQYAKYNTIGDTVKAYGFDYLNANDYYAEMGLDFTTDFYNKNHVNLFGAAKYTEFLENYICSNYNLPDHRGDAGYSSWDEDYQRFLQEEQQHTETVQQLTLDVERGKEITAQLKQTSGLAEWNAIAEDSRYTLLIETNGEFDWPLRVSEQNILTKWELTEAKMNQMRIINSSEITYSNAEDGLESHDGTLGPWADIVYHMSVENNYCLLTINDEEIPMEQAGINIVIFDNNYRKIVDTVSISCEDGKCVVNHQAL